eukprot:3354111-Prymnesium_polylepis.1
MPTPLVLLGATVAPAMSRRARGTRPRSSAPPSASPVRAAHLRSARATRDGQWPMMRPEAVSGATRALQCRGWHEVCVDARTSYARPAVPWLAR